MPKNPTAMLEVDNITTLAVQMVVFQNQVIWQLKKLNMSQPHAHINMVKQNKVCCETCGASDHSSELCGVNLNSVNFVGNAYKQNGQNFWNTYNLG